MRVKLRTAALCLPILVISVQQNAVLMTLPPFLDAQRYPVATIGTLLSLTPIFTLAARFPGHALSPRPDDCPDGDRVARRGGDECAVQPTSAEAMLGRARPRIHGEYEWAPAGGFGGYRHARGGFRTLGEPAVVAELSYDSGPRFDRLPPRVQLEVASPGVCSAVLWTQELWFNDFLIWRAEHFSPLVATVSVEPGEVVKLALDNDWRRTNVLTTVT